MPGYSRSAHELQLRSFGVPIGLDEIRQAAERITPWAHRTPVMTSKALDARAGASVFLKCENFQRVGAFKFRGAMNAVLQLSEAERRGGRDHAFLGKPCTGRCAGGAAGRACRSRW